MAFCSKCGAQIGEGDSFCGKCGARVVQAAGKDILLAKEDISPKSRLATTLLANPFFIPIGMFGAHRFYLGKIGTAVTMLLLTIVGWTTFWFVVGIPFLIAVWIWALVDFIYALSGSMKDKEGKAIKNW